MPPKERILILKKYLTEEEAFKHEIYMIAVLGRKDLGTGILWNFTDGGEGGSGAVRSEETRERMSLSMRGKRRSPEARKNISNARKGISRPHTEQSRQKIREAHLGEKNHFYGKPLPERILEAARRKNQKKVELMRISDGELFEFNSLLEACRFFNLHTQCLSAVCLKKRKSTGGFRARHVE